MDSPFYRTESKYLARLAASVGVPSLEVEHVVQEAWLAAVERREQFKGADVEQRLRRWLRNVVRHKAEDLRRHLGLCRFESLQGESLELPDDGGTECREVAEQNEWLQVLLAKVRVGNEKSHRLLCAHFLDKRSYEELASDFKMKPCAIESRIRRLLEKMRDVVDEDSRGHDTDERICCRELRRKKWKKT
jgi:RNA polymerase sigma factor (sigma-70 family)